MFSLEGSIVGSLSTPKPRLLIKLQDAGLLYRPLDVRYSDFNVDAALKDDRFVLRNASITSEPRLKTGLDVIGFGALDPTPGTLVAEGEVYMSGLSPETVDVVLTAEDFWLTATREYTAAVRGGMDISGDWPALQIDGAVTMTAGQFVFDDSFFLEDQTLGIDPSITIYRKEEALTFEEVPEEPSELTQNLSVDLALDLNRNMRMEVDMPMLDTYGGQISSLSTVSVIAEMDGELDVIYRGGDLSINGDVTTLAGSTTRLFDTTFAVTDGSTVYFAGRDYVNPSLKMEAVHSNLEYGDVNVVISGWADDPQVSLSSDDFDQTDILFLLLFGKPASEMSQGESGAGSLLFTTAIASLSGQVSRAVGSGALVDEFDWDPDSGWRVGKAINESLFVGLERNSNAEDDENFTQVTLEWLITRRMYAEFMTGDMGQSSADLYWRWLF